MGYPDFCIAYDRLGAYYLGILLMRLRAVS